MYPLLFPDHPSVAMDEIATREANCDIHSATTVMELTSTAWLPSPTPRSLGPGFASRTFVRFTFIGRSNYAAIQYSDSSVPFILRINTGFQKEVMRTLLFRLPTIFSTGLRHFQVCACQSEFRPSRPSKCPIPGAKQSMRIEARPNDEISACP